MRRVDAVGLLLLLPLGGCTATDAGSHGLAMRDSAGIAVLEHPASAGEAGTPRIVATEAVSIGALEGDAAETFNRISDLAVDAAGRLHVLDGGDQLVKVYEPDGTFAVQYGGQGEGPAEFQAASLLVPLGDSMGVYDYRNQKLARFGTDGTLLATRPWEITDFGLAFPSELAPVPGGLVGVYGSGCSMPAPEDRRPTWKVLTRGPGGEVRDTVTARYRHDLHGIYGERFCSAMPALAGPAYGLAIRPDGTAAFTEGAPYEVRILHLEAGEDAAYDGELPTPVLILRRALTPAPVTPGEEAAYRERHLEGGDPDDPMVRERRAAVEAALDSTTIPTTHPQVAHLLWDNGGRLWVGRVVVGEAPTRVWDVYHEAGRLVREVELPADLTVHVVAGGTAWGTIRDDLGVMYVKGYVVR